MSRLSVNVSSGVKWLSLVQILRQVIQWGSMLLIARSLDPVQLGLANMVIVVAGVVFVIKDFGVGTAIIRDNRIKDNVVSTLFWLNLIFGLLATIVFYSLSEFIAYLYKEPDIVPLVKVMSVLFFVASAGAIHYGMLEKGLEFNKIAGIEIVSVTVGAVLGISVALNNGGAWSIVFQTIGYVTFSSIASILICKWKPGFIYKDSYIFDVLRYSSSLAAYNVSNYVSRNVDNYLVARNLGAYSLGIYSLGYKIIIFPVQMLSVLINKVLFPLCSKVQNDIQEFYELYIDAVKIAISIGFPILIILFISRSEIVYLVLGEKWASVGEIIGYLLPAALFQLIGTTVGVIYQVYARTGLMFYWSLIYGVAIIVAVLIGSRWSLSGVAISYSVASFILSIPNLFIPLKLIDKSILEFYKDISQSVIAMLVSGIILYLVYNNLLDAFGIYVGLFVFVVLGFLLSIIGLYIVDRKFLIRMYRVMLVR